jgi:hypothetical protein
MLLSSYVFAVKHVRDCLSRCSCNLIWMYQTTFFLL